MHLTLAHLILSRQDLIRPLLTVLVEGGGDGEGRGAVLLSQFVDQFGEALPETRVTAAGGDAEVC